MPVGGCQGKIGTVAEVAVTLLVYTSTHIYSCKCKLSVWVLRVVTDVVSVALSIDRGAGQIELTAMPHEVAEARRVADQMSGPAGEQPSLSIDTIGSSIELSEALGGILLAVVESLAREETIIVRSLPDELTTTAAASMLGVSRPTLMQLIRDGHIRSHKKGAHHRLKLTDVVAYLKGKRDKQRAAYDQLRELLD